MDVRGWGYNERMLVRPNVVINEETGSLGFYLQFFYERNPMIAVNTAFCFVTGTNLLACWRAMIILQKLSLMKEGDPSSAYSAAERGCAESTRDEIVTKIGLDTYDAIMASPFPGTMTTIIINLLRKGVKIDKGPITGEVRVGTIEWSVDFGSLGIWHPREVDARKEAERRLIERYGSHLAGYAQSNTYVSKDFFLWMIEQFVVGAVEKGIEEHYGQDVVMGIAIAIADMELAQITDSIGYASKAKIRSLVGLAIDRAIEWLLVYFKVRKSKRSLYKRTIKQLYYEWQTMPFSHPLPTEVAA